MLQNWYYLVAVLFYIHFIMFLDTYLTIDLGFLHPLSWMKLKILIEYICVYRWQAASGRSTLNLERGVEHEGHPLAITAADAVGTSGASPWNWRETPGNGWFIFSLEYNLVQDVFQLVNSLLANLVKS